MIDGVVNHETCGCQFVASLRSWSMTHLESQGIICKPVFADGSIESMVMSRASDNMIVSPIMSYHGTSALKVSFENGGTVFNI